MIHLKPFTFGRAEVIVIAVLAILTAGVLSIMLVPTINSHYDTLNHQWTSWALRVGYFGAFASAFVGSLSVVIIFPYTIIIFFLATHGLNPFWLGLATGLGAYAGQTSGYFFGMLGTGVFHRSKPETYDALERIVNFRPWMVQFLLLLFSATPLPDDLLFIPLGMLRYPFWKMVPAPLIGKIIANLIIAYTGSAFVSELAGQSSTSLSSILTQLGSLYTLALLLYALWKIDWTKTMRRLLDHPSIQGRKEQPL